MTVSTVYAKPCESVQGVYENYFVIYNDQYRVVSNRAQRAEVLSKYLHFMSYTWKGLLCVLKITIEHQVLAIIQSYIILSSSPSVDKNDIKVKN